MARVEAKRVDLGEAEGAAWLRMREQAMARLAELVGSENGRVAVQAAALVFRTSSQYGLIEKMRQDLEDLAAVLLSTQIALAEQQEASR